MFLAFLGFVFIAVVCIINYDGTQDKKEFGPFTYYVPDFRYDTVSSKTLYDRLLNRRSITCPETTMHRSDSMISLNSVCGSSNPYGVSSFIVGWDDLNVKQVVLRKASWYTGLGFSSESVLTGSGEVSFSTLFADQGMELSGSSSPDENDAYGVVEIVAPFAFNYGNVNTNTENGSDIVIINSGGTAKQKCRITFHNVANWFCAGTPGTTMEVKNGTGKGTQSWEEHSQCHQTIIGNTKNADINGGSAGVVLGYANGETTISIEIYDGSWKSVSIMDLIQATK